MGAQLRVYRRRIRSVQATKKITRAMELIAASRIVKAQQRVAASTPYADELTRAVSGGREPVDRVDHPLLDARRDTRRARPCCSSSRATAALAGALHAPTRIKEAEALSAAAARGGQGGRSRTSSAARASSYYRFRDRAIAGEWTGFSESPTYADAKEIADALIEAFRTPTEEGGVDEIHVVYTEFVSMLTQTAGRRADPAAGGRGDDGGAGRRGVPAVRVRAVGRGRARRAAAALRREPDLHRAAAVARRPSRRRVGAR